MIIDTHCHLFKEDYDNLDILINDMLENNIYAIVNGYDYESSAEAYRLSKKHKNIFCSFGIHPNNIGDFNYKLCDDFINKTNNDKLVAIGEIGLDYYHNKKNKEEQIKGFKMQIELAIKYKKPIIVHTRESIQDVYDILSQYNIKCVIHAFSGSLEMAQKFIKLGYKIGIGGVLTFKNSNLKDIVKQIGLKNVVLETDSPYLAPDPYRGKKNNPILLKIIVKKLSEIFEITEKKVIETTYNNCLDLFDLNTHL